MQVTTSHDTKVYNLSAGKSLPEWISERKRRSLLKHDVGLRQRIELLQDFDMPTASGRVKVSKDGQYVVATGTYKPRVRCYDVKQLSMKFERCFDSEAVQFRFLSEDYSKLVFLQADRHVEFHVQYGTYYRVRIPKFGRDMAYHSSSCDLYLVGSSHEVYRLNLDQGRFLNSLSTQMSAINVCEFNPLHDLFAAGSEKADIECWDPRSRTRAGQLSVSTTLAQYSDTQSSDSVGVTAIKYFDGLNLAVGTSTGQVLLYDIRANRPYHIQDHHYGLPIHSLAYNKEQDLVLSCDSKALKIWDRNHGKLFTVVEPEMNSNELCYINGTGLILMAVEGSRMQAYYIPALGPAPKWCSFLDNLTEELEENPEPTVYDDYKFVTEKDLDQLGLSHMIGSDVLKAYMHGYFVDIRLYNKAKSIVDPFAYEEYRKSKIKEKIDKERGTRVQKKKLPKVNKDLAEKLLSGKKGLSEANPLGDDRFAAMFSNPEFAIDQESEEYKFLHPVISKQEKKRKAEEEKRALEEQFEQLEESEEEGRPSDMDYDFESSSDDDDAEMWTERKERKSVREPAPKFYEIKTGMDLETSGVQEARKPKLKSQSLGKLVEEDSLSYSLNPKTSSSGSKTVTFSLQQSSKESRQKDEMKQHQKDRRKIGRSAKSILPKKKRGPVYWRGKRVK
jgi:ribosome biogenesis protein ENP2